MGTREFSTRVAIEMPARTMGKVARIRTIHGARNAILVGARAILLGIRKTSLLPSLLLMQLTGLALTRRLIAS